MTISSGWVLLHACLVAHMQWCVESKLHTLQPVDVTAV
jgi:hypothetical protein